MNEDFSANYKVEEGEETGTSKEIERAEDFVDPCEIGVQVLEYEQVISSIKSYENLSHLVQKESSPQILNFEKNGEDFTLNVKASSGEKDFVFYLEDDAVASCFRNVGVYPKFLENSDDEFKVETLNHLYGKKASPFIALYESKDDKKTIKMFCDEKYEYYSLSEILDSVIVKLDEAFGKKMSYFFINSSVDIENGFRTGIVFEDTEEILEVDTKEHLKEKFYKGFYLWMPILSKPKLEIRPFVMMGVSGCAWISSRYSFKKKGKEKTMPMDEWIAKYALISIDKCGDMMNCVRTSVQDTLEGTGINTTKFEQMFKSCAKKAHVSRNERDGFVDDCLNEQNVFLAAVRFMARANGMDRLSAPQKQEKVLQIADHVISHGSICPKCLQEEPEDEEDIA